MDPVSSCNTYFTRNDINPERNQFELTEDRYDVSCRLQLSEYLFLDFARDYIAKKLENDPKDISLGAPKSFNERFTAVLPCYINDKPLLPELYRVDVLIKSIWETTKVFTTNLMQVREDEDTLESALCKEKEAQDFARQKALVYHQQGRLSCHVFTNRQAKALLEIADGFRQHHQVQRFIMGDHHILIVKSK